MTRRPKVFLSDDAVLPQDVLPNKVTLALDGDPETEQPYNPIPPRPEPGHQSPGPGDDPGEHDPDEPEEEPLEDEPEPQQNEPAPDAPSEETPATPAGLAAQPPASGLVAGREYTAPVSSAPLHPTVTYRSRISVLEAWRYPGQLAQAPDFIDRSWTAWVDGDIYGGPSGPALRIPITNSISGPIPNDGFKICRMGDYVVKQLVTLVDGLEPEESLDVWPKEAFERLFMPVQSKNQSKKLRKSLADAA